MVAMQAGTLLHRPHVPMLEERNTRKGFFELEALFNVLKHLPEPLCPVIECAYITGWRIPSEVEYQRLELAGQLMPWVFFRMVSKGRGAPRNHVAFAHSIRLGPRPAQPPAALAVFRMTCDEQPCAP